MKLLLTSGGVSNPTIERALADLLGKPIAESSALLVPTATHAMPNGPVMGWRNISGTAGTPLAELGWQSVGVLELTALPTVEKDRWVASVREADALLVTGGDPLYLCHWMRKSGLADLLPALESVYVGVSAGSLVMGPTFGGLTFGGYTPSVRDEGGLGFVDFAIFPHVDHPMLPDNTMAHAREWAAARHPVPTWVIDDDTAIRVVGGEVEIVSEGFSTLIS